MLLDTLLDTISRETGYTLADLQAADRHRDRSDARAVACWAMHRLLGLSSNETGSVIRRHHSTVICCARRVDLWLSDARINPRYAALTEKIIHTLADL